VSARFAILNPCQKRWSDLNGDARKRFCNECQTYVHALDQYSEQEIDDLRRESPGRVCGLLTSESLPEPRSRRAVLVGALLTAVSPLMAQSGRVRIRVTDATGAAIPQAEASVLQGEFDYVASSGKANEEGEVILTDLPMGDLRLKVSCPGFANFSKTITVHNSDELKIDAKLEIGSIGTFVTVPSKRRWWHIFR